MGGDFKTQPLRFYLRPTDNELRGWAQNSVFDKLPADSDLGPSVVAPQSGSTFRTVLSGSSASAVPPGPEQGQGRRGEGITALPPGRLAIQRGGERHAAGSSSIPWNRPWAAESECVHCICTRALGLSFNRTAPGETTRTYSCCVFLIRFTAIMDIKIGDCWGGGGCAPVPGPRRECWDLQFPSFLSLWPPFIFHQSNWQKNVIRLLI